MTAPKKKTPPPGSLAAGLQTQAAITSASNAAAIGAYVAGTVQSTTLRRQAAGSVMIGAEGNVVAGEHCVFIGSHNCDVNGNRNVLIGCHDLNVTGDDGLYLGGIKITEEFMHAIGLFGEQLLSGDWEQMVKEIRGSKLC